MNEERDPKNPPTLGQQIIDLSEPRWLTQWVIPITGGLIFGVFMLMLIMGKAPWQ